MSLSLILLTSELTQITLLLRLKLVGTIGAQKLLRKFSQPEYGSTKDKTETGKGVGLFVNGVEAYSYKSSDKIYYGSIETIDVLNKGSVMM